MSFVNLMGSDLWTEADIASKVQAMIQSRYNEQDELKAARLSRKVDSTESELAYVWEVDSWIADCVEQGRQARIDTAVLAQVLDVEKAQGRLAQYRLAEGKPAVTEEKPIVGEDGFPVLGEDGNVTTELVERVPAIAPITEFILDEEGNATEEANPEWERALRDDEERAVAQAVVDSATEDVKALVEERKAVGAV